MIYTYGNFSRVGPESTYVSDFIDSYLKDNKTPFEISVFIEPDLGVQIPDIVFVFWEKKITKHWSEKRLYIDNYDFRLIHYIFLMGSVNFKKIDKVFPNITNSRIDKLVESEILNISKDIFSLNKFSSIFAVKKIVSFEAKIKLSSRVVNQAFANTGFSSTSYILSTTKRPSERLLNEIRIRDVGLWSYNPGITNRCLIEPINHTLPKSPISWKFNDMSWRISRGSMNDCKC